MTATITVGIGPMGVAVNPVTGAVYVAVAGGDLLAHPDLRGTVAVISGRTGKVTATIRIGSYPTSVAVNPVTGAVYVANVGNIYNAGNGTVSVISGRTGKVTATIRVGSVPYAVAVNPVTGTVYVANSGSNTVSVIPDPKLP
jgi:YVTN family beta-propeller protein